MAYVGVEFSDSSGIGLVHDSWLTPLKKHAFWPPYKTSNLFNKAICAPEEPDQSSWKLYPVKRLFFHCDSFEKAKQKIKKCEETSDLQSSAESDVETYGLRVSNRQKTNAKRCLSDCESSDDDEPISKLLRPPIFPKLVDSSSGGSNSKENVSSCSWSSSSISSNHNIPISRKTITNTLPTPRNNHVLSSRESMSSPSVINDDEDLTLTYNNNERTITVSANGLEKIFKEVRKLREELKEVKGVLKQSSSSSVVSNLPNDIPVEFPLKTIADLNTLEEYLHIQEKSNLLILYLSTLGGNGAHAKLNRILRFVMTDFLATHFNFAGQRNKQGFGKTKLKSVIISAIQMKSSTSQSDVENAIKTWLKHSKQRMEKKKKAADADC